MDREHKAELSFEQGCSLF